MIDLLVASPLLTLFVTVALGTLVGAIPFGPLRFGPAGALFVGLAIGALHPDLGTGLELVQAIALALFVYTVGLGSGATFFRDLRKQHPSCLLEAYSLHSSPHSPSCRNTSQVSEANSARGSCLGRSPRHQRSPPQPLPQTAHWNLPSATQSRTP